MQKVLTVPGLQRVAVGDVDIMDVKTIGNSQVLVIGVRPGVTTLLMWTGASKRVSYTVTVKAPPPDDAPPEPSEADMGSPQSYGPVRDVTPPVTETISLRVGSSVRRAVPGVQRIAVGDADIADITVDGQALDIKGRAAGRTMVLLWLDGGVRRAWRVEVSPP